MVLKVAIVDTSVHHGDGAQEDFLYHAPIPCLFLHQDGRRLLYPGTGHIQWWGANSMGNHD